MEKIKNVKIGADPEVFLCDKNNKLISAIGLVGGSKSNPKYVGDNIYLQEDNVALEFSCRPTRTKEEFVQTMTTGLRKIREAVQDKDLDVIIVSSGHFEEDQLLHPYSMMFG